MAEKGQDAVSLLMADHRKVEGLFEQFEKASGAEKKRRLPQEICTELTIHTLIEEEIFYPACKGEIEDDTIFEAFVEHDGAKMLIAEMSPGAPKTSSMTRRSPCFRKRSSTVKEEEKRGDGMFARRKKRASISGSSAHADGAEETASGPVYLRRPAASRH